MINLNVGEKIDLNVLKNRILTIKDVYDYCLLNGKFILKFNFRTLFSTLQRLHCRLLLSVHLRRQKCKFFQYFINSFYPYSNTVQCFCHNLSWVMISKRRIYSDIAWKIKISVCIFLIILILRWWLENFYFQ